MKKKFYYFIYLALFLNFSFADDNLLVKEYKNQYKNEILYELGLPKKEKVVLCNDFKDLIVFLNYSGYKFLNNCNFSIEGEFKKKVNNALCFKTKSNFFYKGFFIHICNQLIKDNASKLEVNLIKDSLLKLNKNQCLGLEKAIVSIRKKNKNFFNGLFSAQAIIILPNNKFKLNQFNFKGFNNLNFISLSGHNLNEISTKNLGSVKRIYLDQNCIEYFSTLGLPKDCVVYLRDNPLQYIDHSDREKFIIHSTLNYNESIVIRFPKYLKKITNNGFLKFNEKILKEKDNPFKNYTFPN